jgi:lipoprotein-releasing system permease protein
MIVIDKAKEIAILKTMGATHPQIMRIFILDGLLIGTAGTMLGIPLGYLITYLLEHYYTLPNDVYFVSHIPVIIRARDVLSVALSAVGISFLATIYPSRQAARLRLALSSGWARHALVTAARVGRTGGCGVRNW